MSILSSELENFLTLLNAMLARTHAEQRNHGEAPTVSLMMGKRYARMVRQDSPSARSAYGFIDLTNGDLLKSDGWKAPAKGVRGNIRNANPLNGCTFYGMEYWR